MIRSWLANILILLLGISLIIYGMWLACLYVISEHRDRY